MSVVRSRLPPQRAIKATSTFNVPPQGRMTPDLAMPLVGNPAIHSSLPLAPFASPDGLDPQLQDFLDLTSAKLCRWLGEAQARGPLPTLAVLPSIEPEGGPRSFTQLLDDLQLVMDGAYRPSHPGALAHLDPPPLTASIAADLVCAGLNNNLLAEELAPSLSNLERQLCTWVAHRLGMPESAGGVPASGGSLSNLMALVVARQQAGLGSDADAVVLASADAHVSLAKAVRVMGLRADALQTVPVDGSGALQVEALEALLLKLRQQGRSCLAVVATAGTTVRGAVDPLQALADLCARHHLWLHVDAAIGGAYGLSPTTAALLSGVERADSITINPQKLLGITKTSSLLLVADRGLLSRTFATGLPYMESPWGEAHGGEQGLQGSRPAEILKLWLGLRQLGDQGIEQLLEGALQRKQFLLDHLDAERLQLLSGPLHLLACRPMHADHDAVDAWSASTRAMLLDHQFMLSRPLYAGCHHLKAVLGNPHTQAPHLEQLAAMLNGSVQEVP
jgi:L-2,4-diaminobutyrate decarboxylase